MVHKYWTHMQTNALFTNLFLTHGHTCPTNRLPEQSQKTQFSKHYRMCWKQQIKPTLQSMKINLRNHITSVSNTQTRMFVLSRRFSKIRISQLARLPLLQVLVGQCGEATAFSVVVIFAGDVKLAGLVRASLPNCCPNGSQHSVPYALFLIFPKMYFLYMKWGEL